MNKTQPVNKRKIFWVVAIIAVAAIYQLAHPHLERQFNVDLPSLMDEANVANDDNSSRDNPVREQGPSDPSGWEKVPDADPEKPSPSGTQIGADKQVSSDKPFELVPTGKKNRVRSPAGLVYGESHGEHRVDHVLKHAKDGPSRPVHSVFDGDRDSILRLIDEAYGLIKSGSNRVKTIADPELDFRAKYMVDMKRKIGYLGGKRGKRENYPPRTRLSLVLDNKKFVVTAYPE